MGMIKCTECGKEMSDKASVCPNCGCPIEDIKAKLGEIEAEQEAKNKAKEAEKRAKEAAAEAKRQRQEEARKAVTPAMKKKRIAIGAVMVILAVAVGICGWYFGIKIPHDQSYQAYLVAVQNYSEGIQQYNDAVNQYNEKAKEVISANDGFDEVIGTALLGTQNLSGNPLIDEGTDAGGAVETYRTAEEAETRNNYLASFDGAGMFSSGSHMVLGTMVIRTSDDLKASQQETLTNAIIAAMTSLN